MENLVCARIFFSHWPVFFFYCTKRFVGIFFLKSSHPPPLPLKSQMVHPLEDKMIHSNRDVSFVGRKHLVPYLPA